VFKSALRSWPPPDLPLQEGLASRGSSSRRRTRLAVLGTSERRPGTLAPTRGNAPRKPSRSSDG